MNMGNKILVLGSTGKTGKRVTERLLHAGFNVRKGSRNGQPYFNWEKPENWHEVLHSIESVYITFQPDLAVPGAADCIRLFAEKAKACNVKKLVLLSGRGEPEAEVAEQIIINAGLDWTILRASWFMQNFSENFLLDAILNNKVILPPIKALEPFVDADDIADAAVVALTTPGHSEKVYELTGPELLSFAAATALISDSLHRPVMYEEISLQQYTAALKAGHVPAEYIELISYLFTTVLDGRNETTTNDIEKITGRKPGNFMQYVVKTAKTGVWK